MTTREMLVGGAREHIVGAAGHHRDYDELMEMGAEPPHHGHPEHRAPPTQAPHHGFGGHGGHEHHGQGEHGHMQHHPRALPPPHALAHPRHGETVFVPRPGDGYGPPYDGGGPEFFDPRGGFGPHHQHHPHHGHNGHHPHHPHHGGHHPHHGDFEEHEEHERHHQHHPGERRMRIVKEEPKNQRQFPIGFSLDDIAPGDEVDIEVKPQVLFRGERLAIAQSTARYFEILDIKVGKDSQLAATGALTGEAFETRAVGVRMELDTAQPGIVITIRVRNIDTAAQSFRAVLYGAVLE